jgi:D-Tyr-tRNAtyr deacylase
MKGRQPRAGGDWAISSTHRTSAESAVFHPVHLEAGGLFVALVNDGPVTIILDT